jgi:hypothetical protein
MPINECTVSNGDRNLVEIHYCSCSRNCACIKAARCLLCPDETRRLWTVEHFSYASDRSMEEAAARVFVSIGLHLAQAHGIKPKGD